MATKTDNNMDPKPLKPTKKKKTTALKDCASKIKKKPLAKKKAKVKKPLSERKRKLRAAVAAITRRENIKLRQDRYIKNYLEEIKLEIFGVCADSKDTMVITMEHTYALIVKKCPVTIKKVINPDSMQPRELESEKTFFHAFILFWGGGGVTGKVVDMGMPQYHVQNIDGIRGLIKDA